MTDRNPLVPEQYTNFYGLSISIPNLLGFDAYAKLCEVAQREGWVINTDMYQEYVNEQLTHEGPTDELFPK